MIWTVVRRDLQIAVHQAFDWLQPVMLVVLFGFLLSIGNIAGEVLPTSIGLVWVWVIVIFAQMLSLENVFQSDQANGTLDQAILYAQPIYLYALAKVISRLLIVALPLSGLGVVAAILLGVEPSAYTSLFLSLLIGTPTLTVLALLGAALVSGLERGGILLAILILPLNIPVFLFANAFVSSELGQISAFWSLIAMAAGSLTLGPLAIGAVLKVSQEY